MVDLYGAKVVWALENLDLLKSVAAGEKRDSLSIDQGIRWVRQLVQPIADLCQALDLDTAKEHVGYLMVAAPALLTPDKIQHELNEVDRHFRSDLNKVMFESVPKTMAVYYQLKFDQTISDAFPSAVFDVAEGGTCLALSRPTACVFHFVRAGEHGLRALAKAAGVKRQKKLGKNLEFGEWGELIGAIETEIAPIRNWPRPLSAPALEFYNGALGDVRALNDSARKLIMHTRRERFSPPEAVSVMLRVNDFLTRLTQKGVTENQSRKLGKSHFKS
jgi:hypothetical protein